MCLSGAEDLVPVAGSYPGRVRYRPRTEGLFAWIEHVRDTSGNFWEVRTKDGLVTRYGTARPSDAAAGWRDPAAVTDPGDLSRVFGWRITQTRDLLGNVIRYEYLRDRGEQSTHSDQGEQSAHSWDQPLIARICYAEQTSKPDHCNVPRPGMYIDISATPTGTYVADTWRVSRSDQTLTTFAIGM